MSFRDSPLNEKAVMVQDEFGHEKLSNHQARHHGHHDKTEEEIERVDALALAEATTLDSFKHLDEKKILRKMDLRLIPVLSLLYLLSFLDRKSLLFSDRRRRRPRRLFFFLLEKLSSLDSDTPI